MNKKTIVIQGIKDALDFVAQAMKVDGDVICERGRYCVDGKSWLGVMSINVNEGVVVTYPADATEFENFITKFEII